MQPANDGLADEENYLSAIEDEWMRLQGGALRLTAVDWAYADAWQGAGIPLAAVILGMRRSFQSFRPQTVGARIRSLSYCYAATLEAWHQLAPELCWKEKSQAA